MEYQYFIGGYLLDLLNRLRFSDIEVDIQLKFIPSKCGHAKYIS